jgi:hypothetical protein
MNKPFQVPMAKFLFSSGCFDDFEKTKESKIRQFREKFNKGYLRFMGHYDAFGKQYFGRIDVFLHEPVMPKFYVCSELLFLGESI